MQNDSLFCNYFRLTVTEGYEQFQKFNSYPHCKKECLSDKHLRTSKTPTVESKSFVCFSVRSHLRFVIGLVICAL